MKAGKITGGVVVLMAVACYFMFGGNSNTKASSVIVLALKYLSRPHVSVNSDHVFLEVTEKSSWNGSYLTKNPHIFTHELSEFDKDSLYSAIQHFQKLNKTIDELSIVDFPLPAQFLVNIDNWKKELGSHGLGFQLIRGVPVQKWTVEQSEIFFFALGKLLGIPGAQDNVGSLLGHVTDAGFTNKTERPYRQKVDIAFHCDGSDIVGLLCLNPAKTGGISRIISSVAVYNKVLKLPRGQDYIRRLYGHILLFTRKTFGLSSHFPVHPMRLDSEGVLRTYWNQEYYVKSYKHPNGTLTPMGQEDPFALEAVEAYDSILAYDAAIADKKRNGVELTPEEEVYEELGLDMNLQQGDI